ncbi:MULTISPECIES: hypothetical protein [unclassified Methylobacterium]|nr:MULTISPECIES: hypothetical protein [unclassified Methylobacterium]
MPVGNRPALRISWTTGLAAMRYLAILECPVIFSGESPNGMTSMDMCPSAGITRGLISRHVKVIDSRVIAVCIWQSEFCAKLFFDADWYEKAGVLWGDRYQLRLEAIDEAAVA